jgi:hypothetical protein
MNPKTAFEASICRRLFEQCRSIRNSALLAASISGLLIGMVVTIHLVKGVPLGDLVRDPIATLHGKFYTGLLSQSGIFFWAAAAAICFFASNVLEKQPECKKTKGFFIAFGCLSLFLGLDDVFLLHEEVFPRLGIKEELVHLAYVLITPTLLYRYRKIIYRTEILLLIIAVGTFGLSMVVDQIEEHFPLEGIISWRVLLEDGTKLAGTVFWLAYFWRTAARCIRGSLGPKKY